MTNSEPTAANSEPRGGEIPAIGARVRARYALTLTRFADRSRTFLAAEQPKKLPVEILGSVHALGSSGGFAGMLQVNEDQGRGLGLVWISPGDVIEVLP